MMYCQSPDLQAQPLIHSLKWFREEIDERLWCDDSWVLWERFGAGFRALKTNALLYLGITQYQFIDFHHGAAIDPQLYNHTMLLSQLSVCRVNEHYSPKVKKFTQVGSNKAIDGLDLQSIFLNGSNGEGVDLWCAISCDRGYSLLDLDQRKYEGDPLQNNKLQEYYDKVVGLFTKDDPQKYAIGIFSKAPSLKTPNTPTNCYWVNSNSIQKYYFSFSDHPLVSPHVYVNDPAINATWIFSSLSGLATKKLKKIANKIVELRSEPFTSFANMKERLTHVFVNDHDIDIGKINTSTLKFALF